MKRILAMAALVTMGVLAHIATPGADHKNLWCHYPPGQWTGDPNTSRVLILTIDVASDSVHLGHSPSLPSGPCNPASFNGTTATNCAEGVPTDGTASSCPGKSTCTLPETADVNGICCLPVFQVNNVCTI